jgi:thioredoxin-dependent peroxiredoxin
LEIGSLGAAILGISSDSAASHSRFAAKHGFQYPLLVDKGGALRRRWKVPRALGLKTGRVTYVIDRSGVVRHICRSTFSPMKHVEEAVSSLKRL